MKSIRAQVHEPIKQSITVKVNAISQSRLLDEYKQHHQAQRAKSPVVVSTGKFKAVICLDTTKRDARKYRVPRCS